MYTAFGYALLSALKNPEETFLLSFNGSSETQQQCLEYMRLRHDEIDLLDRIEIPENARVLDYGCGIGRHLKYLRDRRADITCIGVEKCDGLRSHCSEAIAAPNGFFDNIADALKEDPFDLVLLMGNGLGILGDEDAARKGLRDLVNSMAQGGKLVIETGSMSGRGYQTEKLRISFNNRTDGPFPWGSAGRDWITRVLENLRCKVNISESQAPYGISFFAVATKSN